MINITSLTQPASPNSRRSSSISALALYNTAVTSTYTHPNNPIHNNSTVVNLYTRQYMQKKKSHRWRLVRTPIPLNPVYRKTLFLAILIPFIGALLFIGATLTPYWENVHFKFIKLLELFSIKQNCSTFNGHENGNMYNKSLTNQTEFVILEDPKRWINNNNNDNNNINNYTLEFVIFRDGKILNWRILKHLYKNCLTVTYKMNEIIGIVVHSYKHITSTENTPKHLSRETITPRLFTRNKYTFTRHEWIQLVEHGDLLDDTQDDEMNRNLWLIMNLQAGIWTMCFRLADAYKPKLLAYSSNIHPDLNIPLDCMSYLQANLSETKNLCIQFLLKMQNNIISCVVVVYLSVAASVLIGAFSTLFRAVPAAMVTGVLYITSGVFIIFANCIHHTKLNRLEYEWGPCYPISQIPRTLYTPDIISVHPLWPVLVSWISSFVFFIASIIWLILTQLMTFENSKTMI
ncbi:unnamed protein product [Schistosoma margrebowiei]|uniref:Uncharacterized protein n=1 Tax=Schistosoma margrebowiei TaxID=48269 RepID=A0AA85AJF5_9TREM|nr:unnamed protein product [Schistosoma margrebowiei]